MVLLFFQYTLDLGMNWQANEEKTRSLSDSRVWSFPGQLSSFHEHRTGVHEYAGDSLNPSLLPV